MTSSTDAGGGHHPAPTEGSPVYAVLPPVLGRESPASGEVGKLRGRGTAAAAGYRADGGDSERLSLRAATVTGARHRLAGAGGEDDYSWVLVSRPGSEQVVIAVADGVGSATRAAHGASIAVEEACRDAAERLAAGEPAGEAVCRGAIDRANQALRDLGGPQGRELATTLVVALVVAPSTDGGLAGPAGLDVSVARVGDSTAMTIGPGGWDELFISGPGADELSSTATRALPTDTPVVEFAARRLTGGAGLLVMTDGIANPLRDGPSTVAPALAAALQRPPTPLTLAALADFARQGCHDDRTLLGLWPRSALVSDPTGSAPA